MHGEQSNLLYFKSLLPSVEPVIAHQFKLVWFAIWLQSQDQYKLSSSDVMLYNIVELVNKNKHTFWDLSFLKNW